MERKLCRKCEQEKTCCSSLVVWHFWLGLAFAHRPNIFVVSFWQNPEIPMLFCYFSDLCKRSRPHIDTLMRNVLNLSLWRSHMILLSVSFIIRTSGKYHSQAGSTNHINMKLIAFNFTLRRYWGGVPKIDKQCHQSSQVCLISDTLSSQSIDKVCEPFLLPSRIEYKDQANQNTAPGEKILRVVCCHSGQPNRSRLGNIPKNTNFYSTPSTEAVES